MEKRKDSLSSQRLCRFCLCQDKSLTSLYERNREPKNSVPLALKILSCVSIEVFPSDRMPAFICNRCKFFMDVGYEYKQICRKADETILQYIQNGTPFEPINWSPSLSRIFRNGVKAPEVGIMKTIVEGGATVQVTAHEISDSDEDDDENVYNVKIGDGSDDGSKSARVKVITSDEKDPKGKAKRARKDSEESDVMEKGDLSDGCWPCDECECTYPLQQLLDLHKMQKHRERTVQCDQCNDKFFSKYDLSVHQSRHSDEMAFQCVACDKKFKRLVLLKRHEKKMHSELPQRQCPFCPATFLSEEELEAHQKIHASLPHRRHECNICGKRFYDMSTQQRHKEMVHSENPAYSCKYCPERFSTVSKLARHVRTHAGERSYPCKYCEKSFMKSHHYTRHLRLKHRETIRSARGPFGEAEQYRCEQCEDSFASQDDLIYHSAIHATQNLTCPLCQEKFPNVDAVTTHIKSHVNGIEFMCDYCELVFTSKEKLDLHLVNAHEDEIRGNDLRQDESSMELDADEEEEEDDDDDDNNMNVKEEDDHMVVEIKKADNFMLVNSQDDTEDKLDSVNSEESEPEATYTELATVDTLAMVKKDTAKGRDVPIKLPSDVTIIRSTTIVPKPADNSTEVKTLSIVRKAEEIKRKVTTTQQQVTETAPEKAKEKTNSKVESSNSGASDKSLRLLEKELQELKRTNTPSNTRTETVKAVATLRSKRPQIHTPTPKLRPAEEKKTQVVSKSPVLEKKQPERRVITKENKEPKEAKDIKSNSSLKEDKETPKSVVKNGGSDKNTSEDGVVRRSTRPSKVKDYAKMVRNSSSQESEEIEDDSDDCLDDDEYKDSEPEIKTKVRRASVKQPVKPTASPAPGAAPAARKRGRPRKDQGAAKLIRKDEPEESTAKTDKNESEEVKDKETENKTNATENSIAESKTPVPGSPKPANTMVSPTGQMLKKVPMKSLPPGVKRHPLTMSARQIGGGEVCEMQIGKKVVKVQKIVMTKAEVEAMAKKGLVEMKDGTMVLKPGIKIPTSDPAALKSSLVGDGEVIKESPSKNEKAAPMRCNLGDEA